MQNDISRQWAFLTPFVPGEMLTAQAKQIESLGMAGIFVPEIYSDPFMGMGFGEEPSGCAEATLLIDPAVVERAVAEIGPSTRISVNP